MHRVLSNMEREREFDLRDKRGEGKAGDTKGIGGGGGGRGAGRGKGGVKKKGKCREKRATVWKGEEGVEVEEVSY